MKTAILYGPRPRRGCANGITGICETRTRISDADASGNACSSADTAKASPVRRSTSEMCSGLSVTIETTALSTTTVAASADVDTRTADVLHLANVQ
jgi:hypothetical protein